MNVHVYVGSGYCLRLQFILWHMHCHILFSSLAEITNATVRSMFTFNFEYSSITPLIELHDTPNCTLGKCMVGVQTSDKVYELYQSDQNIAGTSKQLDIINMMHVPGMYDFSWSLLIRYKLVIVPFCGTEVAKFNSSWFQATHICGEISIMKRSKPYTILIDHYVPSKIILGLRKHTKCKGTKN